MTQYENTMLMPEGSASAPSIDEINRLGDQGRRVIATIPNVVFPWGTNNIVSNSILFERVKQ